MERCILIITVSILSLMIQANRADPVTGCERIEVPMCKGLVNYELTRLPNQFNHRTQSDVYWALQEWWPFMDMMCSANLRVLLCGMYLPKCTPGSPRVQLPCRETCRKAKVRCSQDMQRQGRPWTRQLRCPQFLPKRTNRCIKPIPEKKKKTQRGHVACQRNTLSMCESITEPFTFGSLPNMFLQSNIPLMEAEMQQYEPLLQSGCSQNLRFFLCGVFMPFCVHQRQQDVPFVVPCRELCQEVYDSCNEEFTRTRNGIPWPGKLHCHRYPSFSVNTNPNTTLPCTMQPLSGRGSLTGEITAPRARPQRPNRQGTNARGTNARGPNARGPNARRQNARRRRPNRRRRPTANRRGAQTARTGNAARRANRPTRGTRRRQN